MTEGAPTNMFVAKILPFLVTFLQVKGNCLKGNCEKISLDVHRDAVHDSEFVGHVFHNSVTLNPVQCYTWCIQDCRCLSFNYKENKEGKYCELNEENHFTNDSSIKHSPGSTYYILGRQYQAKIHSSQASCDDDVTCSNGCCENNPCVNGGTCHEICEPTSIRYNCSCPVQFVGKHCEIQLRRSCQDYKAAGINKTGLYNVIDNMNQTFQVFCDFDSEPGFAWNLIESFTLSNKHLFQNPHLVFYSYTESSAVSGDSPNWQAYLIKPAYLLGLRDQSTHWRATCRYNTDGTVYTDYVRASLEDFDIITAVPTVSEGCRKYELVNIRGNECVNCTARTWYMKGVWPLHMDSYYQQSCDFDGNQSGDIVESEDNFGWYGVVYPIFRCTSSSEATTQFWIGGK